MARNFFRIFTENNPVFIPEAKGLIKILTCFKNIVKSMHTKILNKKDTALNDENIITDYNYFVNEQVISIKSAIITCTCEPISFITLSAYTSI